MTVIANTLTCPACGQPWPEHIPTRNVVGLRIRLAREARGLSQTELGQRMSRKRSHVAVSELERGVVRIDIDTLADVARILETPLTFFVSGLSVES